MIEDMCGIDEAGRGPLAGPMVVCGVSLRSNIKGLNDSKKIAPKKREELYDEIVANSSYHIVFSSNKLIDSKGLSYCLKSSITEIMSYINSKRYLIDGNTSFGIANLEHLVKADENIAQVSAASILAKVSRDRYMCSIAKQYPQYNFAQHKGYGTKFHIEAMKEYGLCDLHRSSFKLKSSIT